MPVDPFVVHAATLRRVAGTRWHEVRRGPLDPEHVIAPRSAADTTVPEGAEAVCDVVLESYPGGVMVTGTVHAPWRGVCRRCAVPIDGELRIGVRERFVDKVPAASGAPAGGADASGGPGDAGGPGRPGRLGTRTASWGAAVAGQPRAGRRALTWESDEELEDDEAYAIVDDDLDLRPMVRDAVVLELPLAPLCRADCRGLCPQCGADLNEETCQCEPPRDPRWANLDVLRTAQ